MQTRWTRRIRKGYAGVDLGYDLIRFDWNEAHTVNVYVNGRPVDVFSVGDFAKNAATVDEIKRAIRSYPTSQAYEALANIQGVVTA